MLNNDNELQVFAITKGDLKRFKQAVSSIEGYFKYIKSTADHSTPEDQIKAAADFRHIAKDCQVGLDHVEKLKKSIRGRDRVA